MSFQKLDDLGRKLEALEHALSILGADEATHMAIGGGEKRAEAMANLAGMYHGQATAPHIADWIEAARQEELTPDQAIAYVRELESRRDDLAYEIDGVVIKVDDFALQEELGVKSRSPRWAIAVKFASRQEATRIKNIAVQVGRTGVLTPVALLEPVRIGGVEVRRATLHNMDEIQRQDGHDTPEGQLAPHATAIHDLVGVKR